MQAVGPKYEGEPTVEALANGLASLGRYGDSYMVHAAEGETVVPKEVLEANPGLKNQLLWQMKMMGIENPNRYVVGSEFNSINPVTGQPEFFFKKVFKAVKNVFKKVLPVAAPIIGNMIAPGIGGPVAAALSAKLTGGSMSDALKQAAFAYGAQTLGSGIMGATGGGGMSGFMEGLKSGALAPIEAASNIFASGPTNPLQQGIFGTVNQGTRGLNVDTLFPQYDAQGMSAGLRNVMPDVPGQVAGQPTTMGVDAGQTLGTAASSAAKVGSTAASGSGSGGGIIDFIKDNPKTSLALAGGAALGLGALTPEEEAQFESYELGDPRRDAYDAYKRMTPEQQKSPEGIALLKEAGITPKYDAATLARITGITPEAAEQYQRNRYGFVVGPDMIGGGLAAGGAVNGPGTGTSDSIPAMLSDGEFVMTAKAVDGAGGPAQMYRMMS
ncbi:hypothetical protein, partial [Marinobacter sp.]|uniref:hypothetical protein n=1 Tax=Marinobacter sp. TaxID=50741 RepID=UPI000C90875F